MWLIKKDYRNICTTLGGYLQIRNCNLTGHSLQNMTMKRAQLINILYEYRIITEISTNNTKTNYVIKLPRNLKKKKNKTICDFEDVI